MLIYREEDSLCEMLKDEEGQKEKEKSYTRGSLWALIAWRRSAFVRTTNAGSNGHLCCCICLIARKRRSFHACVGNEQRERGGRPSALNGLLLVGASGVGYRVAIKGRCRGIRPIIWAILSI